LKPDEVVQLVLALAERIVALEAENAALRAQLHTDSHNSSQPPSADGPQVKPRPKSLRKPTGRKTGGQRGHKGHTLKWVDAPDEVRVHAPAQCPDCGQTLTWTPVARQERRQVLDLPPQALRVVEHQVQSKVCPACGLQSSGTFPEGVSAPVQYGPGVLAVGVYLHEQQLLPLARTVEVLEEVLGCSLAQGTLVQAVARCHEQLAPAEAAIKAQLLQAAVVHVDETGLPINGQTQRLHVVCTDKASAYAAHKGRGQKALDEIGIVPQLRGAVVHDGWATYWHYPQCQHVLCNAHHLRQLIFVAEELKQSWAQELVELLCAIKRATDTAREEGQAALRAKVQSDFAARYDELLTEGLQRNPPPPRGPKGRPKRGKAGNLVERLQARKAETLAFMYDLTLPFDNNQAERDLRMAKVKEKVSGCFRSTAGADRFCRLRGYTSTLRKQGLPVLSALRQALEGHAPIPGAT
jgi:transposase